LYSTCIGRKRVKEGSAGAGKGPQIRQFTLGKGPAEMGIRSMVCTRSHHSSNGLFLSMQLRLYYMLSSIKNNSFLCRLKMNHVGLKRRVKCTGITASQAIPEVRERRRAVPKAALTLLMLSIFLGSLGSPARAFTAYNCSNRSNIVKSYSLLEPDTWAATDGNMWRWKL
jgi:hypothetical protein